MKKIFLSASGIIIFAAAGFAQFSYGVQATGNLGSAKISNVSDFNYSKTMQAGAGGGAVVQFDFSEKFAIRSGINFLQQGVKLKAVVDDDTNMKVDVKNKLNYLQIPVNLLYKIPASESVFYVGAGLFFNYGIGGNSIQKLSYTMGDGGEVNTVEKLKAFKKEENGGMGLKKADFGIGGLAGIKLNNGIFANAGYQISLSNIAGAPDSKYKNRGLQLSVGYFF